MSEETTLKQSEEEQTVKSDWLDDGNCEKTSENTANEKPKRQRVWEIDFLRGFCVVLMILDHLALLLSEIFGPAWYGWGETFFETADAFTRFCRVWMDSEARRVLHPIVLFIFFSISGICCSFSKSNLKRGLLLAGVALLYTLATYGVQTLVYEDRDVLHTGSVFVTFGVLHFLAFCVLLYAIIQLATRKTKWQKWIAGGISLAIIIVVLTLYFCYTPPENTHKIFGIFFPPKDIHGNPSTFYYQGELSPGDLFSIIPYSAFFFFGAMIGPFIYPSRRSLLKKLDGKWHTPITFIGRHALIFYLAHLIVLAGILALAGYAKTGSWGF